MQTILIRSISFFLVALLFPYPAQGADKALWEQYKARFISDDGRVIDYYQGLISHSEGQGYGMCLSVKYNDKATFERIWRWTRNNLRGRPDNLFAWQWGKIPDNGWKVIDSNNATDGDILIAYALLRADEKWHDSSYKSEALKIIRDIRMNLSIIWNEHTYLLPGNYGFKKENGFVVNPSHLILPAFRYFAKEDTARFWEKIYNDSVFLIEQSCFGKLCLPADWVLLADGRASVYTERDPYYGSDAIRILLNLSSEKNLKYPKGIGKLLRLYTQLGYVPLWIDLEKDSFSLQAAPAGYYALYALAARKSGSESLSKKLLKEARNKLRDEKNSYYSFSLYLFAAEAGNGYVD